MAAVVQDVIFTTAALVTGQQTFTSGISATGATEKLLIALINMSGNQSTTPPTVASVTDSAGNVWLKAVGSNPASQKTASEIWYFAGAAAGVTSVKVTPTTITGNTNMSVRFLTASGMMNALPVDATNHNANTSSNTPTSNSVSTASLVELVVGTCCMGSTTTVVSGLPAWTHNDTAVNSTATSANIKEQSGYDITSAKVTDTYTFGLSTNPTWAACIVAFKSSAVEAADTITTPTDAAARTAQAFTKTGADSPGAGSDAGARAQTAARTGADSPGAGSDAAAGTAESLSRTAAQTVPSLTDADVRAAQASTRTGADSLVAGSDAAAGTAETLTRTSADSIATPTDADVRAAQAKTRAAADSIGAISEDASANVVPFGTNAGETIHALAETAAPASHFTRTAADALPAFSDSALVPSNTNPYPASMGVLSLGASAAPLPIPSAVYLLAPSNPVLTVAG